MKHFAKSSTIQWLAFLLVTSAPGIGDPIWGIAASAGLSVQVIAWMKIAAFVLGVIGAFIGRMRAVEPLRMGRDK